MDNAQARQGKSSGVFSVRLSTLSIVLMCITVGSLASLVVVATTKEADALSTVALALAVLAFAAQLIVTIAQAQSAAEQTRDTFRINSETKAVLADIQAQAKALVALQANQFDKVLDRAINADTVSAAIANVAGDEQQALGGTGGAESSGPDPEAVAEQLRRMVELSLDSSKASSGGFRDTKLIGQAEATRAVEDFRRLAPESQQLLLFLGQREAANVRQMLLTDSPRRDATNELADAGFLDIRDAVDDLPDGTQGQPVFLTVRGRAISELLDPTNPASWAPALRKRLHEQIM